MKDTTQSTGTTFWRLELIAIRLLLLIGETSAALAWIERLLAEAPTANARPH